MSPALKKANGIAANVVVVKAVYAKSPRMVSEGCRLKVASASAKVPRETQNTGINIHGKKTS